MHIVHQLDKRTGITYAYESTSYWDKELKKTRSKRKLIGRVDKNTGEIIPTDGRNKKHSPYRTVEKTRRDEIMDRIRPMGLAELRKEVIRLEFELAELKTGAKEAKSDL
jgi:hypothetical protein